MAARSARTRTAERGFAHDELTGDKMATLHIRRPVAALAVPPAPHGVSPARRASEGVR
ncbi:hypothetical protein ACFH04_14125 [Streptomyces noboritoensis]|uniref:Uncharacterized protein n=1 Tax=Streptomyces noboritoensis TaxID=67337 RepID=A0ABV6THE3_9ACTN